MSHSLSRAARKVVCLGAFALIVGAVMAVPAASAAPMFPQCPAIGENTGCAILITINADGTSSVAADPNPPNNGPYDGEDDTLTGVQNNASFAVASINLSSVSAPIFAFDGDGICDPGLGGTGPDPACPPGSSASESWVPETAGGTGYEGPNNTFTNISEEGFSGTVNFTHPLPPGGSAYFALEETLTAADVTPGTVAPGSPPVQPPAPAPPIVTITSGPKSETTSTSGTFTFVGAAGGSYECSVDGGAWKPCTPGQTFGPFVPGDHQFQVRETLNGLTGPAATYHWTVDIPKPCVLRVARARVFVFTAHDKIRLVIHYTAWKPVEVTVSYKLTGKKGALALGSASSTFQKRGVFRLPEIEKKSNMAKVRGATKFTVHFKIDGTPSSCRRYYSKRLTIPKKIEKQTVWFQSDSIFAG